MRRRIALFLPLFCPTMHYYIKACQLKTFTTAFLSVHVTVTRVYHCNVGPTLLAQAQQPSVGEDPEGPQVSEDPLRLRLWRWAYDPPPPNNTLKMSLLETLALRVFSVPDIDVFWCMFKIIIGDAL